MSWKLSSKVRNTRWWFTTYSKNVETQR